MKLTNPTPFAVGQTVLLDIDGAETLIVALGATYDVSPAGELSPADAQSPLALVDEFHGEPDSSSMRLEAELGPVKPRTDVFLAGHAVAPRPGTTSMRVTLRVGSVSRDAVVHGKRVWERRLGFTRISEPEPFDRIPLRYENAFGGADETPEKAENKGWEARNPVGRGFFARKTRAVWIGEELPNIEHPTQPLKSVGQRVPPVGFGPIGRHWEPRVRYAGTYDQKWREERIPLLPRDFDNRFHNAAHPDLVAPGYLRGNESVEVTGCTPDGYLRFDLPGLTPRARVRIRREPEDVDLALNSVRLDTDAMQLRLLWKGQLRVHGRALAMRETEFALEGFGT